jgi:hypothetical protein
MSTFSAREYTLFTPTQILRNWREQRPSNQSDLDSNIIGKFGLVYYAGMNQHLTSRLYHSTLFEMYDYELKKR